MSTFRDKPGAGFTLIEVVLAVIVIGILVAVIVPRAQRANVDAKYTGVRQAAAEIGRWGVDWATRNLEAQDPSAICNLNDYVETLAGYVGDTGDFNWVQVNRDLNALCRNNTGGIGYSVADLIPSDSQPRNPFNGLAYFNVRGGNNGSLPQPGLLYLGYHDALENGNSIRYYYFVYTGTDSANASQWHAGMGSGLNPFQGLAELRNGVFMARMAP